MRNPDTPTAALQSSIAQALSSSWDRGMARIALIREQQAAWLAALKRSDDDEHEATLPPTSTFLERTRGDWPMSWHITDCSDDCAQMLLAACRHASLGQDAAALQMLRAFVDRMSLDYGEARADALADAQEMRGAA